MNEYAKHVGNFIKLTSSSTSKIDRQVPFVIVESSRESEDPKTALDAVILSA